MRARAHPRAVGAFTLGAVVLLLLGVVLLSSGGWFQPRSRFTVFFPGSVRGLNPGASVSFRGVRLGEVKEVTAFLTGQQKEPIQIEVVIEIRTRVVESPEGVVRPFEGLGPEEFARELIRRGVRARLLAQSLLTGQKYIDLDFMPDEPARISGLKRRFPELPTTPTAMEKLGDRAETVFAKVAELPIDAMLEDLRLALQSLRQLLESPDLKGAVEGTRRLTHDLQPVVDEAQATLAEARTLVRDLQAEIRGVTTEGRSTLGEARETLKRAERALASLEATLRGADETRAGAAVTLEETARTMKALRNLVDYIQTHPEAMVLGKEKAKEKR